MYARHLLFDVFNVKKTHNRLPPWSLFPAFDSLWTSASSSTKNYSGCPSQPNKRTHSLLPLWSLFPFFRLPLDVRIMIYEEVFRTSRADKAITPDPFYHRRHLGKRYAERTVMYHVIRLQSCQQACDEATAVLYGSRAFFFDDTSYGFEDTKFEASACCWYCSGEGDTAIYDRCHNAHNGKHYLKIPHCDFVGMYDWLMKIGERYRIQTLAKQAVKAKNKFINAIQILHECAVQYCWRSLGAHLVLQELERLSARNIYILANPAGKDSKFVDGSTDFDRCRRTIRVLSCGRREEE